MIKFTACGDRATDTTATATAEDDDLPVQPFTALRAAYGMLLGEDDFLVLMGNPRGKQMVHTSWLHGSGVVWGFDVERDGAQLRVLPGLAVDRRGRELRLESGQCLDLEAWADQWRKDHDVEPGEDRLRAYLIAEFNSCLDRPVPTLADPCDIARKQDSPSRVVETTRLRMLAKAPGRSGSEYHRLRVLFGLTDPDPKGDHDVRDALVKVRAATDDDRPEELLRQFRLMAARDATDRRPAPWKDDEPVPHFPVNERARVDQDETAFGILLATLSIPAKEKGTIRIAPERRPVLLPTGLIQELLCGLAPGLIKPGPGGKDAGGPRLTGVDWAGPRTAELTFDRRIARNSWEDGAITVSSVSNRGEGWRSEHINEIGFRKGDDRIVVLRLAGEPAYEGVRIVIRGAGPATLFGRDPFVPFAGRPGGPPGTRHQGHDTAHMTIRAGG